MPKGPNRSIETDGMFLLHEGARKQLGMIGKIDFPNLPDAERDILEDWNWYNSYLQTEQHAPDRATLDVMMKSLVSSLDQAMTATQPFSDVGGGWLARHEFSAALNVLLREAELEPAYVKGLFKEITHQLDRLATVARVLISIRAERLSTEAPYVSSSPAIRADFFRRLHRTLGRHGLDTGVGINSLMVELVLDLQGKSSDDADPIERRRKDLAREIKLAVNPPKGG